MLHPYRVKFLFTGRIHTAYVGGINFSVGSASVEWYEQGETKGKDIDLAVIESLNPDIKIVRPNDLNESSSLPRVVPPISQKVSRTYAFNYYPKSPL